MGACGQDGESDAILYWNEVALEAHRRDFTFTDSDGEDETDSPTDRRGLHPEHDGIPAVSRILAMVHLAIYEAWHTLSPTAGNSYRRGILPQHEPASADAAVTGAAVAVLSGIYVRQGDFFESKCRQHLAWLSDAGVETGAMASGYGHGRAIGLAILEDRAADRAAPADGSSAPEAPGLYRADPFDRRPPFDASWGDLQPFGLAGIERLHGAMRPPWGAAADGAFLKRPSYREDFAEVARVGGAGGTAGFDRDAEQTMIGLFWAYDGSRNIGVAPRLYNQCVRAIAIRCGLQPEQNALLFALVNMAMADAAIAAWSAKYRFRVWRPIHGVREAAAGYGLSREPAAAIPPAAGAGATALLAGPSGRASIDVAPGWSADPFWRPLGMARTNAPGERYRTPSSPAYPSGHATAGSACFDIVFRFLLAVGMPAAAVRQLTFPVMSDEFSGRALDADGSLRPRHVRTLTLAQAVRENALARLYLGVNWRAALVEGVRLGFAAVSELVATGRGPFNAIAAGPGADTALLA